MMFQMSKQTLLSNILNQSINILISIRFLSEFVLDSQYYKDPRSKSIHKALLSFSPISYLYMEFISYKFPIYNFKIIHYFNYENTF